MKKSVLTAVAVAVLMLTSQASTAQSLPAPMLEVVKTAIASNPEVQARWHNFTAADHEKDAAKAGWRPSVDLNYGIGRELNKTPLVDREYSRHGGALSLNQVLFDGNFTRNEVKRLSYAKLVRYYELLEAAETAALEAVRAYADVARYSALVEEAKQNYVEHKATSMQIEERTDAGVSRRVDSDQATGRLALAESNLLTEISNLHDVSARFQRIVGQIPPSTLPPLAEGLKLKGIPGNIMDAMAEGLPNSPTINAAYENVRASRTEIESRKAGYWPRVDFRVRQTFGSNIDNSGGRSRDTVAEVVMNYNLYRGGADQAREKQAVEFNLQARDLQEKACRDVRQTLAIAYNDVVRLNEQLGYLDQHRLSTEVAREAYRQQFDIGQRTLLDVLDTQNEYFEASRAYLNGQYNEFIAQARTLATMGKLTASLGVNRPGQPTLEEVGQDRGQLPPEELCPYEVPVLQNVNKEEALANAPVRAKPAPAPAPQPKEPTKITFAAGVFFDFDKSVIKPEGRKKLDELVDYLKTLDLEVLVAVGHTDSFGSDAYNDALSLRRVNAVKAYLINKGVDADKIQTEGRGEREPVATNDTREGRAQNRRVEITVVEAAK